jgi:hypothetical protein
MRRQSPHVNGFATDRHRFAVSPDICAEKRWKTRLAFDHPDNL